VEIYLWIGPALKLQLTIFKPVQVLLQQQQQLLLLLLLEQDEMKLFVVEIYYLFIGPALKPQCSIAVQVTTTQGRLCHIKLGANALT